MSDLLINLLLGSFLAILLMVTIGYCARLSKRIRTLQDGRGELAAMVAQFDAATVKATTSMAELQTTSKRIIDALQLKIDKANFLADDLAFMIEKSTKLAAQMEQAKTARAEMQTAAAQLQTQQQSQPKPRPFFEMHALSEKPAPKTPEPAKVSAIDRLAAAAGAYPNSTAKTIPSLETVLQRLANGASTTSESTPAFMSNASGNQKTGPRTDAERQLLEALKTSR